jgi:hypothetical protein
MDVLILVAALMCPIVMGTMMLVMWRGMRAHGEQGGPEDATPQQPMLTGDHEEVARR